MNKSEYAKQYKQCKNHNDKLNLAVQILLNCNRNKRVDYLFGIDDYESYNKSFETELSALYYVIQDYNKKTGISSLDYISMNAAMAYFHYKTKKDYTNERNTIRLYFELYGLYTLRSIMKNEKVNSYINYCCENNKVTVTFIIQVKIDSYPLYLTVPDSTFEIVRVQNNKEEEFIVKRV
jgi:hypothetical protein